MSDKVPDKLEIEIDETKNTVRIRYCELYNRWHQYDLKASENGPITKLILAKVK